MDDCAQKSFARVIVDVPARAVSGAFDYRIPPALAGKIETGSPVLVEFSGRRLTGWVCGVAASTVYSDAKPVLEVLGEPAFDDVAADLAAWIAEEYVCSLSEALRLFLPPGRSKASGASESAQGSSRSGGAAQTRAKEERWVSIVDPAYTPSKAATTQQAVLAALRAGPLSAVELRAMTGPGATSAIATLARAGVLSVETRRSYRRPESRDYPAHRPAKLTEGQREALDAISAAYRARCGTVVLDGVTGSGKTEVYLQAIEMVRRSGHGATVLVPEISLTPQTVGRFRSRFGEDIAVLHSRLSAGERFDEWDRLRSGEAKIAVGARSALFAPVRDLALIIIDEEHDSSYKQGSSPRYHAREVAERMAILKGAALVLGSATPSMETLSRVASGAYTSVSLPRRAGDRPQPSVSVVDMAREFDEGNRSMFSRELSSALQKIAEEKDKAVLLLNRRGFASFLLCRNCGHVPMCGSCSISMTYHGPDPVLACHYCGAHRAVPPACPQCGSVFLRKFGAGTQRVEAELAEHFPQLPVVRMDADTTRGKGGHERCLAKFESLETGILLGTQMVAKGLDYPEVTLVGVLNADTTLRFPDLLAPERTYQMLAQVSGRAGRGEKAGRVIIQSYWPDHYAIQAVATGQREIFLAEESQARAELGYPPFGRLAHIIFSGVDEKAVQKATVQAVEALTSHAGPEIRVLGPGPSPIRRVKRAWRWRILVKSQARESLPELLRAALGTFRARGVKVAIDVDPVDTL